MHHVKLTHEERRLRRKAIAAAVRAGDALPEVCQRFDVSLATVAASLKETGTPAPRGRGKVFSSYYAIAQLLNTDRSLTEIAGLLKVSVQRVSEIYRACRKAGIAVKVRER